MPSPVPAEDELVQVALEMWFPDAVVGAEGPSLEIGENAVDPRQDDVSGH